MATPEEVNALQIEQSIGRLAAQEGFSLVLSIDKIVRPRGGKYPLRRDPVHNEEVTDLGTLTHVSVADSEVHGMCVRLVFIQQLYATCGDDANKIIAWAKKCAETSKKEKIAHFPKVNFQKVLGNIKMEDGALALA